MYRRPFIREGDSLTPGGGSVQPKPQPFPMTYDGKLACFEGDPVYCNTCNSWGVTQCVPPYRPHTGPDGRQVSLDGDLCLCKCSPPPRLKASGSDMTMSFDGAAIAGMAGAEGWLAHAGHTSVPVTAKAFNDFFRLVDDETGDPFAYCRYVAVRADGQKEFGETDAQGYTHLLSNTSQAEMIRIALGDWENPNDE